MAIVSSATKWGSENSSLAPMRYLYSSPSLDSALLSRSSSYLTQINVLVSSSFVPYYVERNTKSSHARKNIHQAPVKTNKKVCMCSPTTHLGSFRCSLHKNGKSFDRNQRRDMNYLGCYPSNRLNVRRSAMTNSLVRICGVEGEMVKRALAAMMIRPNSCGQRRRCAFQARPSRLSSMSNAVDL